MARTKNTFIIVKDANGIVKEIPFNSIGLKRPRNMTFLSTVTRFSGAVNPTLLRLIKTQNAPKVRKNN